MRVEHPTGGRRELLWIVLFAVLGLTTLALVVLPGLLAA